MEENPFLVNFYKENDESTRFKRSKGTNVEFETTMHYIKKYLKPNCKILELGASTGNYSIPLAKMGYDVTAVELLDENLDVLKQKSKKLKNITPIKANALDLSQFKDNTFDLVLSLGPMYHLYTKKDDKKAINEAIRVCKKGGILFFAYLTHSSVIFYEGVVKNNFKNIGYAINDKGEAKNSPEEIFSSHFCDEFENYFKDLKVKKLNHVATDGLATCCRTFFDNLSKKDYETFLRWHFSTCERTDQLGWSSHVLFICKKM